MGNPAPFYGAVRGFTAYVLYGAFREWLGRDSTKLAEAINSYVSLTPPAALPYMNTFLENHDLDRVATVFGGALQMGYALIFSLPSVPYVYADGEYGEEGKRLPHKPEAVFSMSRFASPADVDAAV